MKQKAFLNLLLIIIFSIPLWAQNTIIISGSAVDNAVELPVDAATVYLSKKKDSSVIDYTITDKEGKFKLEVKKLDEPVFFRITDDFAGDYFAEFENLNENRELGTLKLGSSITLNEAVVTGAPPIRIKSDTLEFNASSFKVRPDANVETLLKQLPGVDIDEDGKITVNGKEVNQILVNGKPFFDKDGKIALQNLPAEIINKVQVTDTKTKKEELSGDTASSENASINLTIDEEKNKGFMLKLMAGYGTEDRYESSLMLNYFKGDRRVSVLGSSNNINSVGFSMDEIFDNMGSGSNRSMWYSDDGSFSINGVRFGSGKGITQSYMGGLSYADSFGDEKDMNANYFYNQSDTKNNNYTRQENLLPDNIYVTESRSNSRDESFSHNFNTNFEVKIDSTSTIWVEPSYVYNESESTNFFEKYTVNENNEMLNESNGRSFSNRLSQSFKTDISYFKSFQNKTQLSLSFSNDNKENRTDETNISNTYFYQTDKPDDLRNQLTQERKNESNYTFELEYEIPILDSARISLGAEYEIDKEKSLKEAYDYDEFSNQYHLENDLLSSNIGYDMNRANPYVSFRLRKKKFNLRFSAGVDFLTQKNNGIYMDQDYFLQQDKVLPTFSANGNYKFGKNSSIYVNYTYENSLPTALQLLPIENLSNPLSTFIGNPDLKPIKNHSVYLGINNFNFQTKAGYNIYFGGNFNEQDVTSYRLIDENFASNTTYRNIKGNYNLWGGINLNKSYTSGKSKFRVGGGLSTNHSFSQGFVDGIAYESRSYNFRPRVNFNWDLGEILTINPSYSLNYQLTNYENYQINESHSMVHLIKLTTTNYWPKHFVFGNDFSYTYNTRIAEGFKKDFLLWNTSLAYNFWKDQLTFKVKVYDVLGENTGSSRTISTTAITDTQNDVLTRYVMFSLGFKWDKFGGKKKESGRFMIFD